jgi:hypothetical protein
MPTDIDVKLAEDLAEFRLEVERRFGSIEKDLGEFRTEVRTQLGFIKWLGVFFAGVLLMLVGGAVNVAWNASALNSDVKQMAKQLDTIVRQTAPAPKAGG